MKEDKELFLKVNSVEPVFKGGGNWPGEPYLDGVKVWINGDGHFFPCDQYTVCNPDEVREGELQQVLALIKELVKMSPSVNKKLFGYSVIYDIITRIPYEEIVEKLDNWKKDKEKIRVRDEVYSQDYQTRFVITRIFAPYGWEDATVNGLKKDGTAIKGLLLCNLEKTGLHVDDLDSYLEV